jgi:hypothetical protein
MYISFKKKHAESVEILKEIQISLFHIYLYICTYLLKYEEKIIRKSAKNATCIFFVKKYSRTLKKTHTHLSHSFTKKHGLRIIISYFRIHLLKFEFRKDVMIWKDYKKIYINKRKIQWKLVLNYFVLSSLDKNYILLF